MAQREVSGMVPAFDSDQGPLRGLSLLQSLWEQGAVPVQPGAHWKPDSGNLRTFRSYVSLKMGNKLL